MGNMWRLVRKHKDGSVFVISEHATMSDADEALLVVQVRHPQRMYEVMRVDNG